MRSRDSRKNKQMLVPFRRALQQFCLGLGLDGEYDEGAYLYTFSGGRSCGSAEPRTAGGAGTERGGCLSRRRPRRCDRRRNCQRPCTPGRDPRADTRRPGSAPGAAPGCGTAGPNRLAHGGCPHQHVRRSVREKCAAGHGRRDQRAIGPPPQGARARAPEAAGAPSIRGDAPAAARHVRKRVLPMMQMAGGHGQRRLRGGLAALAFMASSPPSPRRRRRTSRSTSRSARPPAGRSATAKPSAAVSLRRRSGTGRRSGSGSAPCGAMPTLPSRTRNGVRSLQATSTTCAFRHMDRGRGTDAGAAPSSASSAVRRGGYSSPACGTTSSLTSRMPEPSPSSSKAGRSRSCPSSDRPTRWMRSSAARRNFPSRRPRPPAQHPLVATKTGLGAAAADRARGRASMCPRSDMS